MCLYSFKLSLKIEDRKDKSDDYYGSFIISFEKCFVRMPILLNLCISVLKFCFFLVNSNNEKSNFEIRPTGSNFVFYILQVHVCEVN